MGNQSRLKTRPLRRREESRSRRPSTSHPRCQRLRQKRARPKQVKMETLSPAPKSSNWSHPSFKSCLSKLGQHQLRKCSAVVQAHAVSSMRVHAVNGGAGEVQAFVVHSNLCPVTAQPLCFSSKRLLFCMGHSVCDRVENSVARLSA